MSTKYKIFPYIPWITLVLFVLSMQVSGYSNIHAHHWSWLYLDRFVYPYSITHFNIISFLMSLFTGCFSVSSNLPITNVLFSALVMGYAEKKLGLLRFIGIYGLGGILAAIFSYLMIQGFHLDELPSAYIIGVSAYHAVTGALVASISEDMEAGATRRVFIAFVVIFFSIQYLEMAYSTGSSFWFLLGGTFVGFILYYLSRLYEIRLLPAVWKAVSISTYGLSIGAVLLLAGIFSILKIYNNPTHRLALDQYDYYTSGIYAYNYHEYRDALNYFEHAAQMGFRKPRIFLAENYYWGIISPKNPKKAFYWVKALSEQNYAWAQKTLSYFYANGIGVEKSPVEAKFWAARSVGGQYSAEIYREDANRAYLLPHI